MCVCASGHHPCGGEIEGKVRGDNYYIGNPIRPYGHDHTGQYGLAFSFSLLRRPSL